MGKFQVEGPKILTAVFWDAKETANCVTELGKTDNNVRVKGTLLLLMVKLMSCILPAVISIREAFVEGDADVEEDADKVEDGYCFVWANETLAI